MVTIIPLVDNHWLSHCYPTFDQFQLLQNSKSTTNCTKLIKDGLSIKIKNLNIHLLFIATQYLSKLCPCGRYRQLNSVLYPNNHILNSSKIIFSLRVSLKRCLVLASNLKVRKPRLCCFFFKTQHRFLHKRHLL